MSRDTVSALLTELAEWLEFEEVKSVDFLVVGQSEYSLEDCRPALWA
jgi:hypothetical protein